jgi:hypothetical protein
VIATTLGVLFAVVLGCGLFAAAFFSDKSGIDPIQRGKSASAGGGKGLRRCVWQRRRSSLKVDDATTGLVNSPFVREGFGELVKAL